MSEWRVIRHAESGEVVLARAKWCASFWCKFRGLQFVRHLPDDEGLLFVHNSESRTGTAIHMFFMWLSIGVVWLDAQGVVVDKVLAKPWRPAYTPRTAAKYFIEATPAILERVAIGDRLQFDEAVQL